MRKKLFSLFLIFMVGVFVGSARIRYQQQRTEKTEAGKGKPEKQHPEPSWMPLTIRSATCPGKRKMWMHRSKS